MSRNPHNVPRHRGYPLFGALLTILGLTLLGGPALAGETEAKAAISRADAKIEMVTSQAGQAGKNGDQSFNILPSISPIGGSSLKPRRTGGSLSSAL